MSILIAFLCANMCVIIFNLIGIASVGTKYWFHPPPTELYLIGWVALVAGFYTLLRYVNRSHGRTR